MVKEAYVLFLMLGIAAVASGQTSADLSAKYRQITSYEVRPGVIMTPKYAAGGQVCEMVLEKRQKTEKSVVFGAAFSEKEIKELLAELVPETERGRNLGPVNGTVDGDFVTIEYVYENVIVRVYGIIRPTPSGDTVMLITWPKRVCSRP